MGLSNDLSCEAGSLSCCRPNPYNQRFEALFPRPGALGFEVCFAPRRLSDLSVCECGAVGCCPPLCLPCSPPLGVRPSRFICANMGPQGLLVVRPPARLVPHSASLGPTTATRVLSAPVPVSTPPTGLDVCFFFIYLVSDFLAVQFSVSSGCARRCSVSTYAAILVLSVLYVLNGDIYFNLGNDK